MVSSIWLLLFYIVPTILDLLVAPIIAQGDGPCTHGAENCWKCSETAGSYTNGSMYQQNLNSLLSSFSSDTTQNGFYVSSLGQDSNKVNAIALCRGDLRLEDCRSCVSESTQILLRNCSNHKEAILWSVPCMVRYSQNLIFGVKQEDPYKYLPSKDNPSNPEAFRQVLNSLLEILNDKAALGDFRENFTAGHAIVPGGETIYALVQCTPDIDKENCGICLENSITFIQGEQVLVAGARVLKPSCSLRYEVSPFYGSTADSLVHVSASVTPATPTTPQTPTPPPPNKGKTIIIIIVVVIAFNILLGGIYCFSRIKEVWNSMDKLNGQMSKFGQVETRKASKKTDIYSFGVVALEIACGRKPVVEELESSQVLLVDWVWELYGRGQVIEAADPKLRGFFDEEQMKCLMIVGLWCAHPNHVFRPASILEAIQVLNFNAPLPSLPLEMPEVTSPHRPPLSCGTNTSERGKTDSSIFS